MPENPYKSPDATDGTGRMGEQPRPRKRLLGLLLMLLSLPAAIGAAFFSTCSFVAHALFPSRTFPFGVLAIGIGLGIVAVILFMQARSMRRATDLTKTQD